MRAPQPPLEYLVTASQTSLEAFELAQLNRSANLRKELRDILDEWLQTEVDARVSRWILDCRRAQHDDASPLPAPPREPVRIGQLTMGQCWWHAQRTDPGAGVEREREMSARISRAWHVLPIAGRSPAHDFKRRLRKPSPPGKLSSATRAIGRHGEPSKRPAQPGGAIGWRRLLDRKPCAAASRRQQRSSESRGDGPPAKVALDAARPERISANRATRAPPLRSTSPASSKAIGSSAGRVAPPSAKPTPTLAQRFHPPPISVCPPSAIRKRARLIFCRPPSVQPSTTASANPPP
jgi:hypothetical protein